ncbi:MAG TPA: hypothetical protein PLI74_09290, partial [Candidatus Kapabacteria bacterium]|nr:hypothetical protein [Candidatus Kapabacteria bacterium]
MYFGGTGKFFSCFRLHQCFGICILLTNHCDGIMVIILFGAPGVRDVFLALRRPRHRRERT